LLAEALGQPSISAGRMTYNLRRLRLHGLIARIPGTIHYRLTSYGLEVITAYTLAHDRVLRPGLAHLTDPAMPSELRRAYTRFASRSCLAT
jgi:DNA-binding PadR family transcriptional regulator